MAAMGQQQQAGSGDNSMDFLWLIVIVVGLVLLGWYFGKSYIIPFVFQIYHYEITAIRFVLERWSQLANWLHLPSLLPALIPDTQDLTGASHAMQANGAQAGFQTIVNIGTAIGNYLRYPTMVLLAFMAFVLYRSNATLKFKTVFNMNRLKMAEIAIWPQITPIAKLDLVAQDLDKGPWGMSKTPLRFAKDNNLLREEKKDGKVIAVLLPGNAHRVFALQLGALWTSFEKLPVHVQALFAIFAARANRDRDGANKLLEQIAESATNGHQLNFAGIRSLFVKNCNNNKPIGKILGQHAYVLTIMASLLELARTDGVLASAEFLWLKPLDRRLWYMLNTVGRRTAVPEIAGAYAHWLAEKKLGWPLKVPMVDEAVKALDSALQEIVYEPDEE